MTGSCWTEKTRRGEEGALLIGKIQASGDGGKEPVCKRAWLCPRVPSRGNVEKAPWSKSGLLSPAVHNTWWFLQPGSRL